MNKIIHRYLLKEISLPFGLILLILTFVLLMGKTLRLMDLMVNKGVSFIDVFKLIAFLMPSLLVYTIPIALLIAILIGVGRLSNDNEITVMKSSGISLYQLFMPVLLFSLAAFAGTAIMSFLLVPMGNTATKSLLFAITQQKASVGIQEKTFNDDFQGILIYADKIPQSGDYLEGVIISDRRPGQEPATIFARKAYLVSDPQNRSLNLRLEKGISSNTDIRRASYRQMIFKTYDINLAIGSNLAGPAKKASREMTFGELAAELKKSGLKKKAARELMTELYGKITVPFPASSSGSWACPWPFVHSARPKPAASSSASLLSWSTTCCSWEAIPWLKWASSRPSSARPEQRSFFFPREVSCLSNPRGRNACRPSFLIPGEIRRNAMSSRFPSIPNHFSPFSKEVNEEPCR